jgi:UPF0271 protein
MGRILINCDLGENETNERTAELLGLVDAANICCGVHAGSETKTRWTLEAAVKQDVVIGAHPGLAVEGGRGKRLPAPPEFRTLLDAQIGNFAKIAEQVGAQFAYMKLHGSLYHAVEMDESYAQAYLDFLQSRGGLGVFSLAGGTFASKAEAAGLKVWREAFADRGYRSDGSLLPRTQPKALLDAESALARFKKWQGSGMMDTVDGGSIELQPDTFCVHSDSPDAEALLAGLKNLLISST